MSKSETPEEKLERLEKQVNQNNFEIQARLTELGSLVRLLIKSKE